MTYGGTWSVLAINFGPVGRVGHLTFCHCYWQFVVSFLFFFFFCGAGQRGIQGDAEWGRGASVGNLCARLGWLYEILLIIAARQPGQTYLNYFHFNCKHSHTSMCTPAHPHTRTHTDTHIESCAEINWIAISHMKWSFVNEHNNWWQGCGVYIVGGAIENSGWGRGRVWSVKWPHKYVALALGPSPLVPKLLVVIKFPLRWVLISVSMGSAAGDKCWRRM